MRRLLSTLAYSILFAGIGLLATSCIGEIFVPSSPDISREDYGYGNNGSRKGSNDGGQGGEQGGNQGGDETVSIFPGDQTYQIKADAVYYGDSNYKDVNEFVLYLYWGEYDTDGTFKSEGTELAFDILCGSSSSMKLSAGRYTCTSDDFTSGHFLDGYEENGYIYPSFAYYQNSKQDSKTVKITDGTMEIGISNNSYNVKVYFQAELPNSTQSTTFLVNYSGDIPVTDGRSSSGGTEVDKLVEMSKFSYVDAEYWGQVWQDKDGNALPVSDWILYLYGENAEKDKEYAMIEVLTPADSKTLEPGIYNDVIGLSNTDLFKSGAVIAGYSDSETNIAYGTWYSKEGNAIYAASKGQVAIAAKDDLYSITFDFIDEDETYGGEFKGSYTGNINFYDKTVVTKAGEGRGRLQKNIQRNSAPSRNVKAARRISD